MEKVNLLKKFQLFNEHWTPKTIGELNGQTVKIAKVKEEFVWHKHLHEDELFMVVKGSLTIRLEKEEVHLNKGELYIVPKGVQHCPFAEEECWILLFEPQQTKHTGETKYTLTKDKSEWI